MGSRPLRMKVRWGCPPRVLSPPPHRTQSWRPCLPGQPWASGWRSTDRSVPSPRGWTIGFSERGAAHNRALPRCLSSRRCMRSWRVGGWPLSRPEATRLPPPSSLPSMAEWPGGTRAFPRWRERSRCTCAHETPPLRGTVRVSRPRPVSWQPLSRPKLTVLRARQPPPCTPWLSCRFTKPRRSNKCTRVVPTRGWCRSCARRLTSLYERRKSRRGPSGRRCPPWWSRSCSHAARIASYETTSALATLPGPEVGMAPRYTASRYLPAVSPLPQPLDRPCLSTGRGAPRTSVPAYCCHNRCLQHGLGRYMQRAGSLGALDRAPTALAHQLPGAVGSAFSLAAVPATAVGQARASPHGQHCGGLVYQPAGGYTITPHVTARPPSPPLESHAVQVTACCSHPGADQSCGRRAPSNGSGTSRRFR